MKKQLIEARELAFNNADAITKLAETEKRSMTKEEMEKVRGFHDEIDRLDGEIEIADKQEKLRAVQATPAAHNVPKQTKEEQKIVRDYRLMEALRSAANPNLALTGLTLEMHQEAIKEMREAHVDGLVSGGVNVPSMLMRADEQVVNPNEQGGFTKSTELREVINILRPDIAVTQAGARMMTGLQGDIAFTNQDAGVNSTWKTEIAPLDQGKQTFAQRVMQPHRLGTWVPVSLQLLAQSSIDMEMFIREDIAGAIAESVDLAAINGSGLATPVPLGLLNSGIEIVEIGTDGGVPKFDHLVDLETAVAAQNAAFGKLGYVTNAHMRGTLKKERTDAGSGLFTWANNAQMLNGYPAFISNNVPSDLGKGTTADGLSAILFGNWNDLLIGNWAGLNLTVDPYTKAKEGQVVITANTFWDVLARRIASFSAIIDASPVAIPAP